MPDKHPEKPSPGAGRPRLGGPTVGTLTYLLFGPIVWAAHLTVTYGFQSAGCALSGYSDGFAFFGTPGIALVTGMAVLTLLAAIIRPSLIERRLAAHAWAGDLQADIRVIMRWLAGLSIFAVLGSGLAVFVIPVCASLR